MPAIFGNLQFEKYVQVKDKTRLDASTSFVSKDSAAVTVVEIEPEASNGFIVVTGSSSSDWFLDWEYATDGIKTISLRITTDGAPVVSTYSLTALTEANDKLLSNDSELQIYEPDILKWIRIGRNSYLDQHRRSRDLILDWINENGHTSTEGNKLTKDSLVDVDEFKKWSIYLTLSLIFDGISNKTDDVFKKKSIDYASKAEDSKHRSVFRLDLNGDSVVDSNEFVMVKSMGLIRR